MKIGFVGVFTFLLMFAGMAFVRATPNFMDWQTPDRALTVILTMLFTVVIAIIRYLNFEDKK